MITTPPSLKLVLVCTPLAKLTPTAAGCKSSRCSAKLLSVGIFVCPRVFVCMSLLDNEWRSPPSNNSRKTMEGIGCRRNAVRPLSIVKTEMYVFHLDLCGWLLLFKASQTGTELAFTTNWQFIVSDLGGREYPHRWMELCVKQLWLQRN